MASGAFRKDINGLRAVAVVLVVLYHFGVRGFGGGFIGVDEFFVISGFLMTQIVTSRIAAGRFSLLEFYSSRARRIVPALAAMIACLFAFGYFWLDSIDYRGLGKHAAASLGFVSNVVYWRESGYFNSASHEKWLLHTWSLSVEWQFYLVFPVFVLALSKLGRARWFIAGILATLATSFVLSLLVTRSVPAAAFFLLPARGWELLTGSICYLYLTRFSGAPGWTWIVGLALTIVPAAFYSPQLAYPGYWAVAPVLGAGLLVVSNGQAEILTREPFQFLGNISYSLYLWHWPMLVAARYFGLELSAFNVILLSLASVVCAYASYALVEGPIRKISATPAQFLGVTAGATLALSGFGLLLWFGGGLSQRVPEASRVAANEAANSNPRQAECFIESSLDSGLPECRIGAKGEAPTVALWGDSHGLAVLSALDMALVKAGRAGVFYSMSGCPPALGISGVFGRPHCAEFNQEAMRRILANASLRDIFVVGRWAFYADGGNTSSMGFPATSVAGRGVPVRRSGSLAAYYQRITDSLCALSASGKNVFALAPIPEMKASVPREAARQAMFHPDNVRLSVSVADYLMRQGPVLTSLRSAERQCGVKIVDSASALCSGAECAGVKGGRPLYYDESHLSEFGNRRLVPLFASALEQGGMPRAPASNDLQSASVE